MSYDLGRANLNWILEGFNHNPRFRFDTYRLKEQEDRRAVKLIIWRGNELIEPIKITAEQLVESTKSDAGYLELELFVEKQLRERLQAS